MGEGGVYVFKGMFARQKLRLSPEVDFKVGGAVFLLFLKLCLG